MAGCLYLEIPIPISLSWYPHQGIYPKGGVHTTCALLYLYLGDVAIRSRRHGGCCDGHPSRCPMEMMPSIVSASGVLVTARHQHTVPHIWCHAQQRDSIPVVLEQSTQCIWGGVYLSGGVHSMPSVHMVSGVLLRAAGVS